MSLRRSFNHFNMYTFTSSMFSPSGINQELVELPEDVAAKIVVFKGEWTPIFLQCPNVIEPKKLLIIKLYYGLRDYKQMFNDHGVCDHCFFDPCYAPDQREIRNVFNPNGIHIRFTKSFGNKYVVEVRYPFSRSLMERYFVPFLTTSGRPWNVTPLFVGSRVMSYELLDDVTHTKRFIPNDDK